MNINNNSKKTRVFCPLMNDFVPDILHCGSCEYWDRGCSFQVGIKRSARRVSRICRSLLKKWFRPRRLFRKGGRRLQVPTVWERHPFSLPDAEADPAVVDEVDFSTVALIVPEEADMPEKQEDEINLPELIEDIWEVTPDVPDWCSGPEVTEPIVTSPMSDLQPRNPLPESFPPGPGLTSGVESVENGIPEPLLKPPGQELI